MPTTTVKTNKPKRGPFWRRKKSNDADTTLKKSPVRTIKTTSSKRREDPMPGDFQKEQPVMRDETYVYDMSSAIQIDLNTGKTVNLMQTPTKQQQPGGDGVREYPQFSTEYNNNHTATYTPKTEPPTPPSPVKWQAKTHDKKIQSIHRLHQLAQQYNHENSPSRNTSKETRNTPAIQSADTFDQQYTPANKGQNTRLLETVLGVSTACAPHATKVAIKSYASKPTPPSKVVSMSMIKDGSMKFAEVVKDSVLKFVQCAGDIPLDEDGTTARVLCSNGGDWDESYYQNDDEDGETYDKNYTYDDDVDDEDEQGTFTNVSIKARDSPVSLMRNDAGFTDDESLGKTMGKLKLNNNNNVQRDMTYETLNPARALKYRPAQPKIADLASADPLASNIPFDERSLSGGIRGSHIFESDRHAREIALGLDDASMLSDERGEI